MRIRICLTFLLLSMQLALFAQEIIGGNLAPLKYSVHTYSIKMSSASYTSGWGIYPFGTTREQIEKELVLPLNGNGSDYTFLSITNDGTNSYFKVQFNGSMEYHNGVGDVGHYVLGFRETTTSYACRGASAQEIVLYAPFDVDVALGPTEDPVKCPEGSNVYMTGTPSSQTTVSYVLNMENPNNPDTTYINDETWTFDFQVKINDGVLNASNSKIASVNASGTNSFTQGWPLAVGSSNYFGSCTVNPSQSTQITFTIVYNDVVGVAQNVVFNISNILGFYLEPDIDESNGWPGNSLTQQISAMPNVGVIEALN